MDEMKACQLTRTKQKKVNCLLPIWNDTDRKIT